MSTLKTRTRLTTSIDNALMASLNELSTQTRINRSKLLDEAIELLLERHNFKSANTDSNEV